MSVHPSIPAEFTARVRSGKYLGGVKPGLADHTGATAKLALQSLFVVCAGSAGPSEKSHDIQASKSFV